RIDDADLRHVQRACDTGERGRERPHPQLVRFDAVADEARAALGVAYRLNHTARARVGEVLASEIPERERDAGSDEERDARSRCIDIEAEDLLEIGEP